MLEISPDPLYCWIQEGDLHRDLDEAPVRYRHIRGNSSRMRHHTELWRSLNAGDSASASSPEEIP